MKYDLLVFFDIIKCLTLRLVNEVWPRQSSGVLDFLVLHHLHPTMNRDSRFKNKTEILLKVLQINVYCVICLGF